MKAEAREVLRSLTLPREKRTLGEMLDAMTQHVREKKLAGENEWSPSFIKFRRKLETYGLLVSLPPVYWQTPNEKVKCDVLNEEVLLRRFPQCKPYESVLWHLSF
jgi:hypothetical protein